MCKFLLNCIPLKYAGIVISLGETDNERDAYLRIVATGNMEEQKEEEDPYNPP